MSANQNHPEALNRIGWHYYFGYGVARNYNKAFEYFLSSAKHKCKSSYVNVGYCYEIGQGVEKDIKKALEYYYLYDNETHINKCELLILTQISDTLNEADCVYVYPLYIKHNHKDLAKLKTLLNNKYVKAMHFMPSVLSGIIISFLL